MVSLFVASLVVTVKDQVAEGRVDQEGPARIATRSVADGQVAGVTDVKLAQAESLPISKPAPKPTAKTAVKKAVTVKPATPPLPLLAEEGTKSVSPSTPAPQLSTDNQPLTTPSSPTYQSLLVLADANIKGNLNVLQSATINGNLTVSGTFNPQSITTGFISAKAINASGPIVGNSINGSYGSFTNLSSQHASFGGGSSDTFQVKSTATFTNALNAQSTLTVTGASTLNSTLNVTGISTLSTANITDLNVSGTTGFNGSLSAYGGLSAPTFTATSTTATSTISTGGLAIGTNQFVVQQTSGRVGIGTSTPSSILHVLSSAVSPQIALGYDPNNYYTTAISSTGQVTYARYGSALQHGFTYNDTLQVATSTTQTILTVNSTNTSNSTSTLAVYQSGTGPSAIFMGGKVGIGSSTPDSLLSIKTTYRQATSSAFTIAGDQNQKLISIYESGAIDIGNISSTTPTNRLSVYSGGDKMLQILNTGSTLFGTTASTSRQFKLAVDGSVQVKGSLSLGDKLNFLSYLSSDGTVATSTKISDAENGGPSGLDASDVFGSAVANIGDLNGDGVTDLAVGAYSDEASGSGGEGAIHILFMNANGSVTSTVKIAGGLNGGPAGLGSSDGFGRAVASIGDLDGDGITDLAVGAYQDENVDSAEGAVFVLFMNADGTAKSTVKISDALNGGPSGLDASDAFGTSVANIGDLDGDGITDLVVGAYSDESTAGAGSNEGAIHILFMNPNGTVKSTVKISDNENGGPVGLDTNDFFGFAVANIGDLNGDGVTDIAVGTYSDESTAGAGSDEGALHILFMNSNGTAKSTVKISDNENGGPLNLDSSDHFGSSVASIGDLNGDGITDLAVGASVDEATSNPSSSEGALHILFMNSNGTVKSTVKISDAENGGPSGLDASDDFGSAVASLGDLNGDGIIDLAVGASADEATAAGDSAEGAIHILFMTNTSKMRLSTNGTERLSANSSGTINIKRSLEIGETASTSPAFKLSVRTGGDRMMQILNTGSTLFGNTATTSRQFRVAIDGSVNVNGALALGNKRNYFSYLASDGTVASSTKISDSENGGPVGLDLTDNFGISIANIGDLNGDNIVDLAVGAYGDEATAAGSSAEGALHVLLMNVNGTVASSTKISDSENGGPVGLDASDLFGSSVASIGDLNGDGITDLAVGARADENVDSGEGAVHILFMNANGSAKSTVKISDNLNGGPSGLDANDNFGTSVANIGDLNSDGVVDLAVGASADEATGGVDAGEGATFILLMNDNGTVATSTKISDAENGGPSGLDAGDGFGRAIANIGDLDGDGVVDLAVGAQADEATSNPSSGEGSLFILFMNTNGTVKSSVKISDAENGGPVSLDASDAFGYSIANVGDLNGDGVTDLAVGAQSDEATSSGSSGEGAVHILFMNTNGTVKSTTKISDSESGGPVGLDVSDAFGASVTSIGDLDGDGIIDLAVGAYSDEGTNAGDSGEGAMFILRMTDASRMRVVTGGTERLVVTTGGNMNVFGTASSTMALAVVQSGSGDLLSLKNHLPGAVTLSVKSAPNELSAIIVVKSSLEIRQKAGVTWTAKSAWDVWDIGDRSEPAFADLDNDGDLDMLIGENTGISYGYKNIGTASSPVMATSTAWNVADVGDRAVPAFADLDNDGDYDLLIGSFGGISYGYENTGTVASPVWAAKSAWDTVDVGANSSPTFADLDNDGDYDLLIGDNLGVSFGYENTGTVASPVWAYKSAWDTPDIGSNSSPALADLDNDGDYDLLTGINSGTSKGYENTGTVSSPTWTVKTAWDAPSVGGGVNRPAFADFDNDGDYDVLIGEFNGPSSAYENTGSTMSTFFAKTGYVGIGTSTPAALLHVNAGTTGTTVIELGDQYSTGTSGSKGCFNVKNAAGVAVSFYVGAGNTMVVEGNRCR